MGLTVAEHATIVIPTYGSGVFLDSVLGAVAAQQYDNFHVVVVDNNPRDVWRSRLQRTDVDVTVVHQPRNGLQHARNAGVEASRGAYVAFLDDDAVPSSTWLGQLVEGIRKYEAAAVGGTVLLDFGCDPPPWVGGAERALLSELIHADDIPALTDAMYIVGANMCISRAAFRRVGMFDPSFDRTATSLRSSGELEFTRRLQAAGERVSYVSSAIVRHRIGPTRLTRGYLLSRAYWQGRSDALLERKWGRPAAFGYRNWLLNLRALVSRSWNLLASPGSGETVARSFSFAREFGYSVQMVLAAFHRRGERDY